MNLDDLTSVQRLRCLVPIMQGKLKLEVPKEITAALGRVEKVHSKLQNDYRLLTLEARQERTDSLNKLLDDRISLREAIETFSITRDVITGSTKADQDAPIALIVLERALVTAEARCDYVLETCAHGVWNTLRHEMEKTIARIAELPPPPRGLFVSPDPVEALVRAEGHEKTLSILHYETDRYNAIHNAAAFVRDAAGYSIVHFEEHTPRTAFGCRNWRRFLEIEDDIKITRKEFRLWRMVVEGTEPGLWAPVDIPALTEKDRSFWGRLVNNGFAVG